MWICVCGNVNVHIRWNEYTYSVMWKCVFDNVDMCVRWNGNTYLIMWIYVFDNVDMRVRWICPYAWRNVRCAFHGLFVGILRNVRHVIGNPLAAVGVRFIVPANTYTPTKWGTNARLRGYAPLYPLPIIIALSFQLDSVETHLFRRYVCSELIRPRNALAPIIIYGKGVNNWIMYQSFFFHCYLTILLQYKIYRWKRKNYIVSNRCLWVLLQYDYILLTWEYKKEDFQYCFVFRHYCIHKCIYLLYILQKVIEVL